MSLKELNDNWEKQYLGARFSKRLEQKLLREHTERLLKEVDHRIFEAVVVSVLDRHKRIKGIGLNLPNDLILNNFGTWLAAFIQAPGTITVSISLKEVGGTTQTFHIFDYTSATNRLFNLNYIGDLALGTQLQVGSGTTPAARTDSAITTPFTTAPESGRFATGSGSYAAGVISFSGAITAGGSGTVNETGFFARWRRSATNTIDTIMLFHDILAAGVAFTAGQIINVSYSISL